MPEMKIKDMVVLLPGITGSVLQKDGKDAWAISGQAIFNALTSLGDSIKKIRLQGEDPPLNELLNMDEKKLEDAGDGVRATRLMTDFHGILGFWKVDGYSKIARQISAVLNLIPGSHYGTEPANFFEFAYDWRRDNRVAAVRLKRLIDRRLPLWREHSGARYAKVILIGHSMGGIVSRYYLEVLEGWRDCKALITFGTPYRGSVNAVNFLANGYKELFIDATEVLRSCTSVYQLLPIYKMLKAGGEYRRIAETDGLPEGLNKDRAGSALAFHREIEGAIKKRAPGAYPIIPIVGICQPTLQSAVLEGGAVKALESMPEGEDDRLEGGDGTVPGVSAIPIELSEEYHETYFAEQHGSLQNNDHVLTDLLKRMSHMQAGLKLAGIREDTGELPAISLSVDDVYLKNEPVMIKAKLLGVQRDVPLVARIEPAGQREKTAQTTFKKGQDCWELSLENPKPGLYRVEVSQGEAGPGAPTPVHGIFEVAG
jgi:pimeloyl-ACP methyl ester carboxylesterase